VDLKGIDSVPEAVHHVVYRVDTTLSAQDVDATTVKLETVTDEVHPHVKLAGKDAKSQRIKELKLLLLLKLIDKYDMRECVVFCRTNLDCDNLEYFLNEHRKACGLTASSKKYSCCVLAGMRTVPQRTAALEKFKSCEVEILICTDVAARGIDIPGVPYVVNMTLPDETNVEDYIHRVGRVGRAGKMGLAISLVAAEGDKEKVWYHRCSKAATCRNRDGGCTVWFDESNVLALVEERLQQKIPIMKYGSCLELPEELLCQNVKYGVDAMKSSEHSGSSVVWNANAPHRKSIAIAVNELAEMEIDAQNNFLRMLINQRK